jgi:hypothetical protein
MSLEAWEIESASLGHDFDDENGLIIWDMVLLILLGVLLKLKARPTYGKLYKKRVFTIYKKQSSEPLVFNSKQKKPHLIFQTNSSFSHRTTLALAFITSDGFGIDRGDECFLNQSISLAWEVIHSTQNFNLGHIGTYIINPSHW